MSFLTDVCKTALLACITSALSFSWEAWSFFNQTLPKLPLWGRPLFLGVLLISAVIPIFYFALYRNEVPLTFASNLRKLSLIAAVASGIIVAKGLPDWIELLSSYWTRRNFDGGGYPEAIAVSARVVLEASSFAYLLLLIAIYRAPSEEGSPNTRVSGLLEVTSRVAVMLSGLWLAFSLLSTGSLPYFYWTYREQIQRSQDHLPILQPLIGAFTKLLSAACIFAAPYIVSMSQRALKRDDPRTDPPTHAEPA